MQFYIIISPVSQLQVTDKKETLHFQITLRDTSFGVEEQIMTHQLQTLSVLPHNLIHKQEQLSQSSHSYSTLLNLLQNFPHSVCYCEICSNNHSLKFLSEISIAMTHNVEVGQYINELFVLKREYGLSNLPPPESIKIVRRAKDKTEMKVAQINLFDSEGEITILELWNDDAIQGVRYLWQLLGSEDEILLQFKNLEPTEDGKKPRTPIYKIGPPSSFMQDMFSFSVKARITAQTPMLGLPCDLSKQCKGIILPNDIQLLCDTIPLRHISQWHRTIEMQQEEDNPEDLQKLIMGATGLSVLGRRKEPESSTQPDKGAVPAKSETEEERKAAKKKSTNNQKAKNAGKDTNQASETEAMESSTTN